MIDRSKLRQLSLQALMDLRDAVNAEITTKQHQEIRYGSIVTFWAKGRQVRMFVTGFGRTRLQGYEIDRDGNHLHNMKWRAHPGAVRLEPVKPPPAKETFGGANDRPANAVGAF
jgi:hypothetical protein